MDISQEIFQELDRCLTKKEQLGTILQIIDAIVAWREYRTPRDDKIPGFNQLVEAKIDIINNCVKIP